MIIVKLTGKDIMAYLSSCSKEGLEALIDSLSSLLLPSNTSEYLTENRKEITCPSCEHSHVVKNGKSKTGMQHYICRECGKAFSASTNTILQNSGKPLHIWKKYVECMATGMPLRQTAELCSITLPTAFVWRHKILDAIAKFLEKETLEGKIEADETFFALSYKGNHSKSAFSMPRKPHKRGNSVHKKGLSKEQVCVPCAISGQQALGKVACLGTASTAALKYTLNNRLATGSILATDGKPGYAVIAQENNVELHSSTVKGFVQHINNYHSKLKNFIVGLHGVATKYLNNYIVWNTMIHLKECSIKKAMDSMPQIAFTVPIRKLWKSIPCRNIIPSI